MITERERRIEETPGHIFVERECKGLCPCCGEIDCDYLPYTVAEADQKWWDEHNGIHPL